MPALRRGSAALSEGEALRICLSLGACLPYIPPAACMPNEMQMSSPPIWLELSQRSHFSKPSSQWIAKWSVSCKMCNPPPPLPSALTKRAHLHSCKFGNRENPPPAPGRGQHPLRTGRTSPRDRGQRRRAPRKSPGDRAPFRGALKGTGEAGGSEGNPIPLNSHRIAPGISGIIGSGGGGCERTQPRLALPRAPLAAPVPPARARGARRVRGASGVRGARRSREARGSRGARGNRLPAAPGGVPGAGRCGSRPHDHRWRKELPAPAGSYTPV